MYLKDVDLTQLTAITRPILEYKSDGNTPTIKNHYVYKASDVLRDKSLDGIYIQKVKCGYSNAYYVLIDYGKFLYGNYVSDYSDTDELRAAIKEQCVPKIGKFKECAEAVYNSGAWLKNVYMYGLRALGENELADQYDEYHAKQWDERRRKDEEWKAENEKRRAEEEAAKQKEIDDAIQKAESIIRNGGTVENEELYGKSLFILLMDKYGVNPALRTRGWIINSLASVEFLENNGIRYRFWRTANGKGSTKVYDYLYELKDAIMGGVAA